MRKQSYKPNIKKQNFVLKKQNNFRINAKRIYLTYSQVDSGMQSIDVLYALRSKNFFCFKHVISKQDHKDGATHFHVLLEATKKFNITQADFLDITYQEKAYHGNYQAVRSLTNTVEYICKAGDYITDFTNIQQGKVMSHKQLLIQSASQLGVSNALIEHCKQLPDKALHNVSLTGAKAYFKALQSLEATQQASDIETPFKLKDFNLQDYPEILEWIKNPVKTLVLMGASGVGKTQLVKAFAQDKGLNTLVINHMQGFKDLESKHDAVIVDDANFRGLNDTQLLAVVDNQQNKTLRVLYGTANKKKGLIQMFTMNKQEFLDIKHLLQDERFARRMLFSEIKAPIINMNVNIQVNNVVNHNYAQVADDERKLIEGNRKRLRECV